MPFGVGSCGGDVNVARNPREVQRYQRAEKVSAVDGAESVGEQKVKDDASPETVRHAESRGVRDREALESEQ